MSAIAITTGASLVFTFLGGIELTANVANFTIFMVFLAVNLSVIQFSRKGMRMGRGYLLSAIVGSLTSVAMLFQFGWDVTFLSILMTAAGASVFFVAIRHRSQS